MQLKFYNTLMREKSDFFPLDPSNVRVYLCGPTIYDDAHVGNARPIIVFDVLYRLLLYFYGKASVTYVRNITDIDDKINRRAASKYPNLPPNDAIRTLTEATNEQFQKDVLNLHCLPPTIQPRATDHLNEMISIIKILLERDFAYRTVDHVLFDVEKAQNYGKLSKRVISDIDTIYETPTNLPKRNMMDFVLWKPSSPSTPGWPSPWGYGRPGWHIECSAMSWKYLGEVFDIHCGGVDLIFPHHENEIAQSTCAFGNSSMAQVWLHNGYVLVENEKMSKSFGNTLTIRKLLEDWPGNVLRLYMLKTHYRQKLNWSIKGLEESHKILNSWQHHLNELEWNSAVELSNPSSTIIEALADDLNTPKAIFELHALKRKSSENAETVMHFANALHFLGLLTHEQLKTHKSRKDTHDHNRIDTLIQERLAARARKNFIEGDRIREKLKEMGIRVKDTKNPVTGELESSWTFDD